MHQALLARKAKKAAKEVAAKQAANAPVVSKMSKDVIVKVNKDPILVTTVLKLIPEESNISKWLTMGTSVEARTSEYLDWKAFGFFATFKLSENSKSHSNIICTSSKNTYF